MMRAARVLEVHGNRKRGNKQAVLNQLKRTDVVLRDEDDYVIVQNKNEFILWVNDDVWGIREFHITANGNYQKTFKLSRSGKIRIIVVKGELRLQQDGQEMVFPAK